MSKKANVEITLYDKNNNIKLSHKVKNIIVYSGLEYIASRIVGDSDEKMSHMAVGSDPTLQSPEQNDLLGMLGNRVEFSSPPIIVGDQNEKIVYMAHFPPGVSTGTIVESGIFNSEIGGKMLCRTTFPPINKLDEDSVLIKWTIDISNSQQTLFVRNSNTTSHLWGVASNDSIWVAVGAGGKLLTSIDGVEWTERNSGTTLLIRDVVWDGSVFFAPAGSTFLTSANGIDWTVNFGGGFTNSLAWNGSMWVAVGTGGSIYTSNDGTFWTGRLSGTNRTLHGIVWNGSMWVAVGENEIILTSINGIDWTERRISSFGDGLQSVGWFNDNIFVAVGWNGVILTSRDGIIWTNRQSGTTESLFSVFSSENVIMSVGLNGEILTSSNGITWTKRESPTTENLLNLSWNGSRWVLVGENGTIVSGTMS